MSRANEANGVLKACPVCETPVDQAVNLGLKDFAWANEALPGRLGLMDFDGVLHQAKTGRMLVLEFKPRGARVSTGARMTFSGLIKDNPNYDVWIVWDQGNGRVKVAAVNDKGYTPSVKEYTRAQAGVLVRQWWEKGLV